VLVEAMACGLPVVATTAGGVAELVRHGDNGLLAAPRDRAGVAAHLTGLLADAGLRGRLGAAARRTVETDYDVNVAAGRLCRLFTGVAS
jgi:glycosyltransferase involved in cell wall biosynthesis